MVESLTARFANAELVARLQAQMGIAESARAEAEEANRAKSRFLAAASHDLRQPMHALGLFVSALKPHVAGEQGPRILERVESTVRSTEVMFNAMLDVSRLDAGVLVPDVKPFPLAPLLARLAAEYAPRAQAKGLRLRLRAGEHGLISDPTLLERVIRNYLGNAVRYTQRGGLLLGCRRRGTSLSIELWDTGQGIPVDNLDDVYKEFYQVGNPERDRAKGLGLGLAIVKRIAQLLGHPIGIASRVGRGSKFSIAVPLAPASMAQAATSDQAALADDALLVGACVLVIDDEADAREAIEVLLKQWGCLVLTADCEQSALELLRQQDAPPDAILSDYRLREASTGIGAIQAIGREFGTIPAALITGDTAPDRLKEATASGYELLHKPLNAWRLKSILCGMLGESAQIDGDAQSRSGR
jgi:two-component system, sensor histidine kinase